MNKKSAIIIIVLLIAGLLFFKSKRTEQNHTSEQNTGPIVAFGDSLVYGVGATDHRGFVTLLSERIGVPILNAGIPGDTSVDLQKRIQSDVLGLNPRIVIIVIGGNDFLERVPKETTLTNVRSLVQQLKEKNAQVILVGVSELIYNSEYYTIAKEEGVLFVPRAMDRMFNNRQLMADPIHPNDDGYKIFADEVEPYLLQALQ